MQSYQGHPGDPEWSKYSSSHPTMISTILNELSVQIVSDPFPKPKQFSNLIRFHQCQSPCTNQFQVKSNKHFVLPFSDFNHRAQNKYKSNRHFVPSFLSKPAFKQTQIQIQQAFCSFLFIQACLQANTKQITITVNTEQIKAKQIKTNTRQDHP